jgi:hypothetical protein
MGATTDSAVGITALSVVAWFEMLCSIADSHPKLPVPSSVPSWHTTCCLSIHRYKAIADAVRGSDKVSGTVVGCKECRASHYCCFR